MAREGSSGQPSRARPRVLAVDDDGVSRALIGQTLGEAGIDVVAVDVDVAGGLLESDDFDLVMCDGTMPGTSGLEFLKRFRSIPRLDSTPFMFVTSASEPQDVLAGIRAGADDYITKPFDPAELTERVNERLHRVSRTRSRLLVDVETFSYALERELARVSGGDQGGVLAVMNIPNLSIVERELGETIRRKVIEHAATRLGQFTDDIDTVGMTRHGDLAILLPSTTGRDAADRLRGMSFQIARLAIASGDRTIRPVPTIGFTEFTKKEKASSSELFARAVEAAHQAENTGDLQPRRWISEREAKQAKKKTDHHPLREALQVFASFLLGIAVPYFAYFGLYELGVDVSWPIYLTCVITLVFTGVMIWTEGFAAMRHPGAPAEASEPEPPASAIICAYLPNEADTIVETVEHFLSLEYEPGLQVILAYNTPQPLPVENELRELAAENPSLLLLHVRDSNSKAQNVNAAIGHITGRFIGVFDADHHPDPGSFQRAWRWLSNGYTVVQGHCLARNPEDSFLSKMVAVEFESIYGTNHPGRWMRDGFGIFGGSNGYWTTEALHIIRMRGSMLTEDIDSSMRLLESGAQIASDPHLISRELATTTPKQIWNQRLRWAQGWTQVSIQHCRSMLGLPHFNARQRFGVYWLLFHREIYPWLSLQIFPLLLFWWARGDVIDWVVPIFLAATIFTMTVGPGLTFINYRLSHPSIKKRSWFFQYGLFGVLFYTEAKNVISRVAHLKELMGESSWRVTPRSADPGHGTVLLPGHTEILHVTKTPLETSGSADVYQLGIEVEGEPARALDVGPEYFATWSGFAATATPGLSADSFVRALNASKGAVVQEASQILDLEPLELSMVAFHLWGKSFRQEREERADRYLGRRDDPTQRDGAKAQMTQLLLSEIIDHLRAHGYEYLGPRSGKWAIPDKATVG